MTDYLTRHSHGFSLTEGRLDPALCPFTEFGFADYPQKRSALAAMVGTDQFLWAVEKSTGFRHYEQIKLVEWRSESRQRVYSDMLTMRSGSPSWKGSPSA